MSEGDLNQIPTLFERAVLCLAGGSSGAGGKL